MNDALDSGEPGGGLGDHVQRGAPAPTRRETVPALERILNEPFRVLDHGFVRVVDYMGGDNAIVQAARVSYGKGTKRRSADAALIRYLLRHRHTTPFEMCEIKLHIKLPIFVARQWIRHRTANVNEYSARYSKMDQEYYIPDADYLKSVLDEQRQSRRERETQLDLFEPVRQEPAVLLAAQSTSNKQGREGQLTEAEIQDSLSRLHWVSSRTYGVYRNLLNEDEDGIPIREDRAGIARELARAVLPVNYYTQLYWKCDLHNLLHFLSLRADSHAQYEIRAYAALILDEIVKRWAPLTYHAFQDYVHRAASLSAGALDVVRRLIAGERVEPDSSGLAPREWRELMAILDREP
ncbi:MAG: FAD-dependent thymidylate synthase [Alphaproteobacteria bacterium]|nr:FAD-dependent thymidylate synthase [Alphaproteobacteria bacterium]